MAVLDITKRHGPCEACKALRPRHVGMGVFWACSMLTYRSSLLISGTVDTPGFHMMATVLAFLANMTTLFLIASLVENRSALAKRLSGTLFCLAIIIGMAAMFVAGHLNGAVALAVLLFGAALTGIGYGFFWGSWAEIFGRMHPTFTAVYVPLNFLVATALFLLVMLSSSSSGLPALAFMIPMAIVSLLCLRRCMAVDPHSETSDPSSPRELSQRHTKALASLAPLIMATLVVSLLFGFVWSATVFSLDSVNDAHRSPQYLNLLAATLLLIFVVTTRRIVNLNFVFQVVIPLSIILFIAAPLFWDANPIVLNAAMSALNGVFDVVLWCSVATAAFDHRASGFVVGGLLRAVSLLLRVIGIGAGYLVSLIPGEDAFAYVCVSCAAVYLLVIIAFAHWTTRRRAAAHARAEGDGSPSSTDAESMAAEGATDEGAAGEGKAAKAATAEYATAERAAAKGMVANNAAVGRMAVESTAKPSDEERLAGIVRDYGLTRREAEVLPYLAKGRSAKVIAEALYVSESTIRTHIRKIFEKIDVHSKQELIDFVESY